MREKYISLSHFGGTVKLANLTTEEKETLQGFFTKSFEKNKTVSISFVSFQKALSNSRFSNVQIDDIIAGYFNESIESKRQQKLREEREWEQFLDKVENEFEDTFSGHWLKYIKSVNSQIMSYFKQQYNESHELFYKNLTLSMKGANLFPVWTGTKKRMDIFATEVTGDPHFFDVGTQPYRILFYIIEEYLVQYSLQDTIWEMDEKSYVVERRMACMYQVGLLFDETSNRTVAFGLHLRKKNGELHKGLEGFGKENEEATVMLRQMRDVVEVYGNDKNVYVFENPSVFSVFVSKYRKENVTSICTNGQLMFTSLLILDLLVKSGHTIYYSGDFDPEGLRIADKLKIRYKDSLVLWHYSRSDYYKSKSEKVISKSRLSKLDKIISKELGEIVECLKIDKVAGYQEGIISDYIML